MLLLKLNNVRRCMPCRKQHLLQLQIVLTDQSVFQQHIEYTQLFQSKLVAHRTSTLGSSVCKICEAGMKKVENPSNGNTYICEACPKGTFARQGALLCSDCDAGFYTFHKYNFHSFGKCWTQYSTITSTTKTWIQFKSTVPMSGCL